MSILQHSDSRPSATILPITRPYRARHPGLTIPRDTDMMAALNGWKHSGAAFSLTALATGKPHAVEGIDWPRHLVPYSFFTNSKRRPVAIVAIWDVPLDGAMEAAGLWAKARGLGIWIERPPSLRVAVVKRGTEVCWPVMQS
jgi:hypothetical protein